MPPFAKILKYYTEGNGSFRPLSMETEEPPTDLPSWARDEWTRLWELWQNQLTGENSSGRVLAGVDEVGRGPAAGPVVACAVVFLRPLFLPGLTDSKIIPKELRRILAGLVKTYSDAFSIASVPALEIDRVNILNASLLAMKKAVEKLKIQPDLVLADGNRRITSLEIPQRTVIKGDSKCYSIAGASIPAKEFRDRLMDDMDRVHPGYGFSIHKGYCTRAHMEALNKLGPCEIHRKSFAPVRECMEKPMQMNLL